MKFSSSFSDHVAATRVLRSWRRDGAEKALSLLSKEFPNSSHTPLLEELRSRLHREPGPRLLVDTLWLSRPYGGITRVWNQILRTWLLPGITSNIAPIAMIDRGGCPDIISKFSTLQGNSVDPLDCSQVSRCSEENTLIVKEWGADVFCSTWISSTSPTTPSCPEVALVHDLLPERFRPRDPALLPLRRRWWGEASAHLSVSADTAADLSTRLPISATRVDWCHPAPDSVFCETYSAHASLSLWENLRRRAGLNSVFVLLPATSSIGSYKNPELVGTALSDDSLDSLQLVLCGIAAEQRAQALESRFPLLRGRILAAGFNDSELAMVYRHALAVLIPSRIEGFGLPAIEVMAAGGLPFVADVRGLREAGAEAAMRFTPDHPKHLIGLLQLLLDPVSRAWLQRRLQPRTQARLARLNPDLIGLSLLAQARRAAA